MNLLDPVQITPEVLRRALILYCDQVRAGIRPFVFDEADHDVGLDGRFNLSMMGRCIEEALVLDEIARLPPACPPDQFEAIVRRFFSHEHSRMEHDRFIMALKTALCLKRHDLEEMFRPIRQQMLRETQAIYDEEQRRLREAERVEKAARKAARQQQPENT